MVWFFLALFAPASASSAANIPSGMVVVGGGEYSPLFKDPTLPSGVMVESYYIDKLLVSNDDFTAFTTANPEWSKQNVKSLFADTQYLHHFPNITVSEVAERSPTWLSQPVTNVSWFAARAYCKALDKRLPALDEWEYAARASRTEVDASHNAEHLSRILSWYSALTSSALPGVSETPTNVWGIQGMHGVVWEMVNDFNSVLITGESRGDTQLERELFCGAGAASSSNPSDYAAFMRYALRSSYEASYTLGSLGFRCAKNIVELQSIE